MFGNKITKIQAREILDSRGNPTIETKMWSGGVLVVASVPSGASTGAHEAVELRDGDKKRYNGKGVLKAVKAVNDQISKVVVGMNPAKQEQLDNALIKLDGTENKSRLGANAILSVSLAAAKLAAKLSGRQLYQYLNRKYGIKDPAMPLALFNVINGGAHASNGLDIQEYFIIPKRGNFAARLEKGVTIFQALKEQLRQQGSDVGVGDEGGFAPRFPSNEAPLELLAKLINKLKLKVGPDVALGIDAAASEFFAKKTKAYTLALDKKSFTAEELAEYYQDLMNRYKLEILEDPLAEDDTAGWQLITQKLNRKTLLVGDDLFVTNGKRLVVGIAEGLANAVLIKPNQIGTLSQTIATIRLAQKAGYKIVMSHRSGETLDTFIADLAVAVGADYIKAGAPDRGERVAKYNRLLEIESHLS